MVTPTVYLELNGVWTNVTDDVLRRESLSWSRGIFDTGPQARLARPGSFTFQLDNSEENSAQTAGYYSPGHASVRAGFRHGVKVKLHLTDGVESRYVWAGTLKTIAPDSGVLGPRGTSCLAVDWISLFSDQDAVDLVLRENVRPDELLEDLVDLMPIPPANMDFDVGEDEYPFAFDDLGGATSKCPQVAQDILDSEAGFLYVRGDATDGETLRFENRFARSFATTVASFDAGDILADDAGLEVPSTLEHIVNDVLIYTVSRRVDDVNTTVLVQLDGPIEVDPGETVRLFLDYKDPEQEAEFVGGKDLITPLANTDWTANELSDGTGANLTGSFSISIEEFGSRVMVEITTTVTGFVRGPSGVDGMRVRGRGLYRYAPIASRGTNEASILEFGRRPLPNPIVMVYQDNRRIGQDIATFIANTNSGLANIPRRVRIATERDELTGHGITRDIGDRIEITEVMTAVDEALVFINAIQQELDSEGHLHTWWSLAPADTTSIFIFDSGMFDVHSFGYG